MTTVSDVIFKTNFEDVFAEYKKHYGEEHKIKVMDIVQKLKEMNPSQNSDNMILFIRAIKENECGDDVVIDTFDCDDKTIFLMYVEKMMITMAYIPLHLQIMKIYWAILSAMRLLQDLTPHRSSRILCGHLTGNAL